MRVRGHNNKSGQPPQNISGGGIRSGTIPPTFEQIQSGAGAAGATGQVLCNYIWSTLINK
jgi:hypothetical protein